MKKLINKFAHACGLYTADDVEHIEKHWRDRLDKAQSVSVRLEMGAGGAGGGGVDMRGAGGKGGKGGYCPGHSLSWYSPAAEPPFIPSTAPQGQTLIINPVKPLDNPSAPTGQRMTGAERRELAHNAVHWCKQQRIETSPENIIFYLDDRRMISAPAK